MGTTSVGVLQNNQTTQANNTGSTTAAFPRNVKAGSLLLVTGAVWRNPDPSPIAISDTLGNTYTVLETGTVSWASGAGRGFIAYAISGSSGACTVTCDPASTGNYINLYVIEGFGPASSPVDATGTEASGTSTGPSATIDTTVANALVVAVMIPSGGGGAITITPTAPSVELFEDQDAARQPVSVVLQVAPTATTYTFAWTLGASVAWRVITRAFKPAVEGGGGGGDTIVLVQANQGAG